MEHQQWRIDTGIDGLAVAVERLCAGEACGPPVIYVHGATFPMALAVNWRFADGVSWRDDLVRAGRDVWTFDFLGFGRSDRYAAMAAPPTPGPLGRSDVAVRQLAAVADHVRRLAGAERVDLIAHSAGSLTAGRFAAEHPEAVARLVLFGPILRREGAAPDLAAMPGWTPMSLEAQWTRFVEDVPPGHPALIPPEVFAPWGRAYLATDPQGPAREPPAVGIPSGPRADVAAAWAGEVPYDPARIAAPVTVIRGEWDSLCTDADVAWLGSRLGSGLTDVKLATGTHLMLLESSRRSLWAAARQALEPANSHSAGLRTVRPAAI